MRKVVSFFFVCCFCLSLFLKSAIPCEVSICYFALKQQIEDLIIEVVDIDERATIAVNIRAIILSEREKLLALEKNGNAGRSECDYYYRKLTSLLIKLRKWERGEL